MKKLFFSLFALFLFVGVQAQITPKKAYKKASRALSSYKLDPKSNGDKLKEAKELITTALNDEAEYGKLAKTWQLKGEIYLKAAEGEVNKSILDKKYEVKNTEDIIVACKALKKAYSLATKKYEKKDAIEGLQNVENYMNVLGNNMLGFKKYAEAYDVLGPLLKVSNFLKENGGKSILSSEEDVDNSTYIVAFCANAKGDTEEAGNLFKGLIDKGYKEPSVYSKYFNILMTGGKKEEALAVLNKGRELFPDNIEILFAEINYYIKEGNYEVLEQKLKLAIAKDSTNPTIYSALGNVYMNLFNESFEKVEKAKADEYFNNSLSYFDKALSLNSQMYDAVYSMGSLYFNKAAALTKEMNNLGLSKADQAKYTEMDKEVKALFVKALPYFKNAEKMNPSDRNTLIGLKEIFARMNEFEKSKEFKNRLEILEKGGKIESSYFK